MAGTRLGGTIAKCILEAPLIGLLYGGARCVRSASEGAGGPLGIFFALVAGEQDLTAAEEEGARREQAVL